ncbi:hypothetical protein [Metabacillus endolithicus]|uniref:Uncharacterized protein n=1 Tax=Metabacillus endolithicus TaxID=1535204 RepID=A0ABW5C3K4_9BACI|nr:hypothetical protein [Metabacillus endolithicus]UPG66261.1 hypothetical protein MVE64_26505 [Metabacillus endolithicus]
MLKRYKAAARITHHLKKIDDVKSTCNPDDILDFIINNLSEDQLIKISNDLFTLERQKTNSRNYLLVIASGIINLKNNDQH